MDEKHADEQIANDYQLWEQYADPQGIMGEAEFNALSIRAKIDMLHEMFPDEPSARARRHVAGTAPDTSLWLGNKRRAWLREQGGIQPTIQAMIDRAMKRK
jgi:hypothetical protein